MRLQHVPKRGLIVLAGLGVGLVLIALLMLGLWYSRSIPLNYDEGNYLMFGTLANQGFEPYSEIFSGIPPLGILTVQVGLKLLGGGLNVRFLMLLFSLVGAASILWVVRYQAEHSPIWTGLLAALLLFGFPTYFFQSALIMIDVPAISLALLSIALIQHYRFQPSSGWLLLSGIGYGLSLAFKLFVLFLPLIIALQLLEIVLFDQKLSLRQRSGYNKLVKMGLIWLVGVVAVLAVLLLIYSPTDLYQQVIAFHMTDRAARVTDSGTWIQKNSDMLLEALGIYLPVVVGAMGGLLAVGRRGMFRIWIWPAWFVLAALFLFIHVPLRSHHMVILLPPLAALSSIAITHIPYRFKQPLIWLSPVILLIILGLTLFNLLSGKISFPQEDDFEAETGRLSAVEFVQQTTGPGDCIVVDDSRSAIFSGRPIPPGLSEPSHARVTAGLLSTEEIIDAANNYDCPILIMGPRFADIPGFAEAAESAYSLKLLFANADGSHTITVFAVRLNSDTQPAQTLNHSFGQQLLLKGVDLAPALWQPGQLVSISTYWQAQRKMERDYKIFLHLKDAQGNIVYSVDHFPFETSQDYLITYILPHSGYREGQVVEDFSDYPSTGLLPTRLWIPGNTLKETVNLTLPTDISPGTYSVEIGVYDPTTLEQLFVQNDGADDNQEGVVVVTVEVADTE